MSLMRPRSSNASSTPVAAKKEKTATRWCSQSAQEKVVVVRVQGVRGQEDVVAESDKGTSRADATAAAAAAPPPVSSKRLRWWAVVLANIVFVLGGQSVGCFSAGYTTIRGGDSLWLATVVQSCGAPLTVLLLLLLYFQMGSPAPPLIEPSERWWRQSSAGAGLDGRLSPSAAGSVEKRGEEKK
ncbi:unknown protein [Oryza sativa Japonica Group]|uniref:Os01g0217100 protein n=2 Tax=Oryza sativa subsp. japonica TaxID=39947 RepID=A0A0P0UZM9_ORYSJ|nr:probable purine permease 11 isoform X2 [Oryza sativa Japonica Group]BAD73019.1 unknown protein [Oryza sativa Japonica Group]BAD73056.1 unknown protein [Oryza sativa Japonica Group]BAF04317.1 Os01g0217100 [Oryza sativa Japonica Group]BAG94120.1 unnamed protein product [Oryza sativa Japonica Group]BAS71038.1 Os01g0217100 [Oryza sativa Japonica Group]|eukprot:NP_001042403.1 Os01g0217100 [Oryza sativa Japonica Group]